MKLRGVIRKNNGEIQKKTGSMVKSFYLTLKKLEQKYRTKIREIEPQDKEEQKKSTDILIQEAKTLFEQEKLKEAEGKYIEAISIDSKCSEAYEGLADTYMELKDFEHAKEIYRYLLKMNCSNDATYRHLGAIAAEEGNLKEAEQDYLKSISLNEEVAGYHVDLGEVYLAMDDKEKAFGCFEEAVKLEPNNPRNLDHLITTSIALDKKDKAQEYFEKLQKANPENEKLKEFKQQIKEL
ncbi:MAG: tetratricopeptide repeat protein [Deltaproteobacteria bacterium]|nr:tetratricopeptide repeat protein [Deltaproteobacteria bacterium]